MKAAKDGDVTTLVALVEDKKMHIDTRGPDDYVWVSWQYSS